MKAIILAGLAAGALTVLLCSSKAGEKFTGWVRKIVPKRLLPWYNGLTSCAFCASWWISLAMLGEFSITEWAATVAIANFTILLIHWSMSTIGEDNEEVVPT